MDISIFFGKLIEKLYISLFPITVNVQNRGEDRIEELLKRLPDPETLNKFLKRGTEFFEQEISFRKQEIDLWKKELVLWEKQVEQGEKRAAQGEEFLKILGNLVDGLYHQNGKWASRFTPLEIMKIFHDRMRGCKLLVLVSKPDLPANEFTKEMQRDINTRLSHNLSIFMEKYYPEGSESYPVEFYDDFFDRPDCPISKADLKKLEQVLAPIPTIVLYTNVTSKEVYFKAQLIGKVVSSEKVMHWTCEPWYWKNDVGNDLEQFERVITLIYQLLAAFLSDCYFLSINSPLHKPLFLTPEMQKELLLPESNGSLGVKLREMQANFSDFLNKKVTEARQKLQEREEREERERLLKEAQRRQEEAQKRERELARQISELLRKFAEDTNRKKPDYSGEFSSSGNAESAAKRVKNFLNSELSNMWTNVRCSSGRVIAEKLPTSLPLPVVSVSISSRTESEKVPGHYETVQTPVYGTTGGVYSKSTRWIDTYYTSSTYYRVEVNPSIGQAIDSAINTIKIDLKL